MRRAAGAMRDWPGPLRWLVAELIPLGSVFLGLLLTWVGVPPGSFLGFLAGVLLTVWYLNWVQDAHAAWCLPLILLMLATMAASYAVTGRVIVHHAYDPANVPYVVTPAYWEAFGGLLAALAVTVALAVVNGERHRGRYSYMATRP